MGTVVSLAPWTRRCVLADVSDRADLLGDEVAIGGVFGEPLDGPTGAALEEVRDVGGAVAVDDGGDSEVLGVAGAELFVGA